MKNIASMTAEDVYSDETLDEVFSDEDEIHKAKVLLTLEDRAAQLGVKTKFAKMVSAYKKVEKQLQQAAKKRPLQSLDNWTNFDGPYDRMYCGSWIAREDGIWVQDTGRPEGFLSPEVVTKDWSAYKKRTEKLVVEKRYAEALEHYQWFIDHIPGDMDMAGERRIWGLGGWARLGKLYPPARTALAELRDRKEAGLRSQKPVSSAETVTVLPDLQDIGSINRYLGEEERTLALFRRLDAEQPVLAQLYWPHVEGWMIDHDQMELAEKYIPDINERWEALKGHIGKTPGYHARMIEEDAVRLAKVARSAGQKELADRIRRELKEQLQNTVPTVPSE